MPITALTPRSFEQMQLNAGVFLVDFDHSTYETPDALTAAVLAALDTGDKLLGATIGGGSFQATPTMRQIEVDGKRFEFPGSSVNDGWTVKLTGTMKEITPENFARALPGAQAPTVTGNRTVIRVKNDIKASDYIPKLCWVGDISGGGFVLIEITSALNLTGANFTFTDKGEGTLPFEFQAHQSSMTDVEYAPVQIVFLKPPSTP